MILEDEYGGASHHNISANLSSTEYAGNVQSPVVQSKFMPKQQEGIFSLKKTLSGKMIEPYQRKGMTGSKMQAKR